MITLIAFLDRRREVDQSLGRICSRRRWRPPSHLGGGGRRSSAFSGSSAAMVELPDRLRPLASKGRKLIVWR